MKKTICSLFLAIGICMSAYCFEDEPAGGAICNESFSISIKYRRGYASIDTFYLDNKASLDSLVTVLGRLIAESPSEITISVKGGASPDGSDFHNRKLSEKRALLLREYIIHNTSIPAPAITIEDSGIDWMSLKDMISATDQPWRDEAVLIISDTPVFIYDSDNRIVDGRKNRLGMLHGGRAWRYMEEHFFPDMRNADVRIGYVSETPAVTPADTKTTEADMTESAGSENISDKDGTEETTAISDKAEAEAETKTEAETAETEEETIETAEEQEAATATAGEFTLLLKTNMLYDIAAVPNLGLEIPLGKHWSVGADWMYAWWKNNNRHRYWRIYGGDLEVRRWFPPRRKAETLLCGHHVGLYGQMLTYDFEWGGKGQLGDKWTWGAGLSYGYSLPIAKQLNIDFTVGVGYLQGRYMVYHPEDDCYVWDSTRIRKWFGPTKAEISLVWFIGGRNWKKGGGR